MKGTPLSSPLAISIFCKHGSAGDADAIAFIAAGGITDPTQIAAINYGVTQAKAQGLWARIAAWYPIIGGTALAHSKNLRASALHPITWVNSPTHDASGFKCNGSTSYGTTVDLLPTELGITGGLGFIGREVMTLDRGTIGAFTNGSTQLFFLDYNANSVRYSYGQVVIGATVLAHAKGEYFVSRSSPTRMDRYFNGVSVSNVTTSVTGITGNQAMYVGTWNQGGAPFTPSNIYITQCRFLAGVWSDPEILAFYNICLVMETMLGRNV